MSLTHRQIWQLLSFGQFRIDQFGKAEIDIFTNSNYILFRLWYRHHRAVAPFQHNHLGHCKHTRMAWSGECQRAALPNQTVHIPFLPVSSCEFNWLNTALYCTLCYCNAGWQYTFLFVKSYFLQVCLSRSCSLISHWSYLLCRCHSRWNQNSCVFLIARMSNIFHLSYCTLL